MNEHANARILIVEDDPLVLELLVTRLELAGYRTSQARDGAMALETLKIVNPDAVVLDLNMPRLDGFGFLTVLSRKPAGLRPPVLVLTARNSSADVKRCLELGAKDYLAKPFDDKQLLARVARLLRKRVAVPSGPPPIAL